MLGHAVVSSVHHFPGQLVAALSEGLANLLERLAAICARQSVNVLEDEDLGSEFVEYLAIGLEQLSPLVAGADNASRAPARRRECLARRPTDNAANSSFAILARIELADVHLMHRGAVTEPVVAAHVGPQSLAVVCSISTHPRIS